MIIYISAPYTIGRVNENIHRACIASDEILKKGHIPYIPHLNHLWDLISPKDYHTWLRIDIAILERCDAVLRLDGESKGADLEVETAKRYCMPVYYSIGEVPNG